MDTGKIQLLVEDFTMLQPDFLVLEKQTFCEHLHINRKSIEFTKVGGIDSFGDIPFCDTTTSGVGGYPLGIPPSIRTGKLPDSGLSTCSCAPPRASKGVESSLYSSVPPVNQWLDSYQRSIREMRELREFDKEIREQGKSGDINESYRRTE